LDAAALGDAAGALLTVAEPPQAASSNEPAATSDMNPIGTRKELFNMAASLADGR
jgi:hypothetical protein